MSNLKLPSLAFDALARLGMKDGESRALAYATGVKREGDSFVITHHFHPIATIESTRVTLSNCGWNSSTTANRLHKVAVDNDIHTSGFMVAMRRGLISLVKSADTRKPLATFGQLGGTAEFVRYEGGTWSLASGVL